MRYTHFDPFSVPASDAPDKPLDPFRVIIPCGGRKEEKATLAKHLYTGSYFRSCYEYATSVVQNHKSVLILSAKHGLIDLFDWVEPYEMTFRMVGAVTVPQLKEQAKARGIEKMPTLVLGGQQYVDHAMRVFKNAIALTDTMDVRGIGKQIQWLKNNKGRLPSEFAELARTGGR